MSVGDHFGASLLAQFHPDNTHEIINIPNDSFDNLDIWANHNKKKVFNIIN
jgi:hypothetical protein